MIYDDVLEDDYFGACKPYVTSFLDVNQDQSYEVIFSCGRYSVEEQIHIMYEFVQNAFKVVISNQ